jgi:hypothetical protein
MILRELLKVIDDSVSITYKDNDGKFSTYPYYYSFDFLKNCTNDILNTRVVIIRSSINGVDILVDHQMDKNSH